MADMINSDQHEQIESRSGGCVMGILLIPLQIIYSIVTIPIMIIAAVLVGIAKLFGNDGNS